MGAKREIITPRDRFYLQLGELPQKEAPVEEPSNGLPLTNWGTPLLSGRPDISTFNEGQLAAFNKLIDWTQDPRRPYAVLKGYAGTGKTFTVSRFMHLILSERVGKVCFAAPTHKALKAGRDQAVFRSHSLDYNTIHSVLALTEKINANGDVEFVREKNRLPSVGEYTYIILDEVSMLNDDLFNMLHDEVLEHGTKILFVGDPCQIPPVGALDCIPFQFARQVEYNMVVCELDKIVRQAEGNPLIDTTLRIRNGITSSHIDLGGESYTDTDGVGHLSFSSQDDKALILDILRSHFTSPNFTENADYVKVVAWTNRTVDDMNDLIRNMLYGKKRARLEVGERLIVNKPILRDGATQLRTSDEMLVKAYTIKSDKINGGTWELNYYEATVEHLVDGAKRDSIVWILHEDSLNAFKTIQEKLAAFAKSLQRGSGGAAAAWKEFYDFTRRYADVKYNYAITAHKAQGSTYENVLVMSHDILVNKKVTERNRILYTACSRPKRKLFVAGW